MKKQFGRDSRFNEERIKAESSENDLDDFVVVEKKASKEEELIGKIHDHVVSQLDESDQDDSLSDLDDFVVMERKASKLNEAIGKPSDHGVSSMEESDQDDPFDGFTVLARSQKPGKAELEEGVELGEAEESDGETESSHLTGDTTAKGSQWHSSASQSIDSTQITVDDLIHEDSPLISRQVRKSIISLKKSFGKLSIQREALAEARKVLSNIELDENDPQYHAKRRLITDLIVFVTHTPVLKDDSTLSIISWSRALQVLRQIEDSDVDSLADSRYFNTKNSIHQRMMLISHLNFNEIERGDLFEAVYTSTSLPKLVVSRVVCKKP